MNNNKAPGIDGILTEMVKKGGNEFPKKLSTIFNSVLTSLLLDGKP